MEKTNVSNIFFTFLIFLTCLILPLKLCSATDQKKPFSIGVLLPLSGRETTKFKETLEWGKEIVNKSDGIDGHKIKLIYQDSAKIDLHAAAVKLLDNPEIKIVIGPNSSSDVFELLPLFIQRQKLLISPTATSTDIYRAFAGKKYFWRTCQGDIGQIKTILHLLKRRDVKKIALLGEDTLYGQTFFDWLPFYCIEMDIQLLQTVKFCVKTRDFSKLLKKALENNPEYLVVVSTSREAVHIVRELKKLKSKTKLIFADAVQTPYFIKVLGKEAEGLEGTAPALNPESNFGKKYVKRFREEPFAYAATTWDAFLLAVYTLVRNYQEDDEPIDKSLNKIINGKNEKVDWNEINKGIRLILSDDDPDIQGATGKLEFDEQFGVDPLDAYYAHWVVENGQFVVRRRFRSRNITGGKVADNASLSRTKGSSKYGSLTLPSKAQKDIIPKKKLQAVILSSSHGWKNYRHQADALAYYQYLKQNGVKDQDIVLFLIDDIAKHEKNPSKGSIRQISGGENLYENAEIDYRGKEVNPSNLENVILGIKTPATPQVIKSDHDTNILLFIVGHGEPGKILFPNQNNFTEDHLEAIIKKLYEKKKYRRILIIAEVCYGECMAKDISLPGVIYFTGSSRNEQSFGTNYDSEINNWLANDFSYTLLATLKKTPNLSIAELYTTIYSRVSGSHVKLCNYQNFGDIRETTVIEFFIP